MQRTMIRVMMFTLFIAVSAPAIYAQTEVSAKTEVNNATVTDQDLQLMRRDIRSIKKQLVAANMQLTDTEAEKFWPVYDQYTGEAIKIYDTRFALAKDFNANYRTLTDAQAQTFVKRWADSEVAMVQLRLKYLPILEKVVGGKKSALFVQIDRRLALMIDLQVASEIPLVQP